mgnify:CR=1 FL=1
MMEVRVYSYCKLVCISIHTQKMLLEKYCKDNGYEIYDYYIDDGYSGLNYNRPNFQRMLQDIENGKIDLVITKDLSRLGRDYIMTGYYTEIYFNEKGVRYIAVNDNIDIMNSTLLNILILLQP